jgi:hypothetical protein
MIVNASGTICGSELKGSAQVDRAFDLEIYNKLLVFSETSFVSSLWNYKQYFEHHRN